MNSKDEDAFGYGSKDTMCIQEKEYNRHATIIGGVMEKETGQVTA